MKKKQREIYVINPTKTKPKRRRRRKAAPKKETTGAATKGALTMKKRRRSRKKAYRKNPSTAPRRGRGRRVAAKARKIGSRMFSGLSFKTVLKNMPAFQIGMWAAKKAARSLVFGDATNYATENDAGSWNYMSYLKGSIGGIGAALLVNMLKPGMGQKVLEGAANLMVYKALMNEVVYKSDWATAQFGADTDADEAYTPDEYLMTGANEDWFLGQDGGIYPTDELYRLPEATYGTLEPVGPLGRLEPVGPLGFGGSVADAYRSDYFHQI